MDVGLRVGQVSRRGPSLGNGDSRWRDQVKMRGLAGISQRVCDESCVRTSLLIYSDPAFMKGCEMAGGPRLNYRWLPTAFQDPEKVALRYFLVLGNSETD